jgi:Glycosyltransferase
MKILHLFSSKVFAGLERHLEELAYEQSKSHEVIVVGPESLKENFRCEYKVLDTNQWRHSPILYSQTKTIINSIAPDILHTHASKMTSIVNKFNHLDLHVSTIHGTKKNISLFQKTDFIFGASQKSLEGISSSNSMVLENWVDESRFNNYSRAQGEYFLYLGRFEPVKNPKRLINAWKGIDEKLIMVGEGALKSEMQNLIEDLNLSDQISLEPETNDVAALFSKAKALVILL